MVRSLRESRARAAFSWQRTGRASWRKKRCSTRAFAKRSLRLSSLAFAVFVSPSEPPISAAVWGMKDVKKAARNAVKRRTKILLVATLLLLAALSIFYFQQHDVIVSRSSPVQLVSSFEATIERTSPAHEEKKPDLQAVKIPARGQQSRNPRGKTITFQMEKDSPAQVHAVMYASHQGRDDRFCRAIESAVRHNVSVVVLGWGVKWTGLSQKLEAAHAYASSLPPKDIILFTDAFDVMYATGLEPLRRNFLGFKADIVFGAECGCWPHIMINESLCFSAANGGYPTSPTPYRYLNSGTWMGYSDRASEMLLKVIQEAGANFTGANDQELMANFYMAGRFGIKLDFSNKLFQSMHMTLEPPFSRCFPHEDVKLDEETRMFYNTRTGSFPSIFHFNGGGKLFHLRYEKKMWYKKTEASIPAEIEALNKIRIGVPTQPDGFLQFGDPQFCGNYTASLAPRERL